MGMGMGGVSWGEGMSCGAWVRGDEKLEALFVLELDSALHGNFHGGSSRLEYRVDVVARY